jgi:O-antigen ligase
VDARWSEQISFFRFLMLLILFVSFIKTPRQLGHAVAVVLLMILLLAADGAGVFEGGWDSDRAQAATFGGFAGNQNRLGFLCVWGIALFWALRFRAPAGWWRRITLVPLLALPIVTLMTGSRSGLLQLMLLAGLILLEQRQWSPAQRTRAFALVAVVALVVVLAAPSAMVQRATTLDMGGFTTIHRLHTYEAGIMMVLENPLFGVGPGNFDWRNHVMTGRALSAHNSYLWALTSGGPLLLILYLAVFHRIYRTLRTVERHGTGPFVWLATALRLNLITLLLFSFFGTIWQAEPFWLLVGLTIVVARVSRVPLQAAPPTAAPVLVAAR